MIRRVERRYIDRWIIDNGPDGLLRLADRSGVSSSTIIRARNGRIPTKPVTLEKIAEALELPVDIIFPPVDDKNEAS